MVRKKWQSVEAICDLLNWENGMCGLLKEGRLGFDVAYLALFLTLFI
jgi:hypothetical protein